MKKYLWSIAVSFLVLLVCDSCRKGPEDPLISFRSRKNRMTGQWKIVSGYEKYIRINSNSISSTTISDNTYFKTTSGKITESGTITIEYYFEKNGTYRFLRTEQHDGSSDTIIAKGLWSFLNANENRKNKEAIILSQIKYYLSAGAIKNHDSYATNNTGIIWTVQRLKNKSLIIHTEVAHTAPNEYAEELYYELKQ